jgi:large subunit ribosomal protein L3
MTQIFDENGGIVPVTVVDTSDCFITQIKTKANDGYNAIQVGFGSRKPQNVSKSQTGHFKKASVAPRLRVKEIRLTDSDDLTQLKAGVALSPAMFVKGDRVDVTGVTKGKGFQGVMKRLGFSGKDATHGTSKYFRHGGSNGTNTCPGRVLKNKGMPGQTGDWNRTIAGIEVFDVREKENLLLLRGAVPGSRSGFVMIRSTKRAKAPAGRSWTGAGAQPEATQA